MSAASVSAQSNPACDPGELEMVFSHVTAAVGHPKGEAATALADRINADLNGQACMTVYPNSELYADDDELFQAMLDGEVHFAAPSLAKMSPIVPQAQLFDLPFLFDNMEELIDFTYTPEGESILEAASLNGYLGLGYWLNGMREMSATVPIRRPEDVQGLTFRLSGSPVGEVYYDMLGVETITMSFSKVYDALATGEVDGQENSWSNIYTKSFYTVQDGVTETNHGVLAYMLFTSEAFMDSLDPGLRAELEQIILEVTHERNGFAYQLADVNRNLILQDGGVIRTLNDEERQAWVDALLPVWDQFEDAIGADLIQAASGRAAGL
ncbi:DctP family TRAP transporter solute-binding subunit [Pontivivens ytuae]|uniref:DctP family TRAP transporter solute-binding subunit n=1 Tax=Pontivivens ytuae TaxID=2789856 RepID=A0A7S9LVN8_9RHOB|nr:DctP family TRAP transporter solute-binding subunit [Pontivivens ytuae]QPH55969.1 DctP family TRAP transporter solute-binding subunit [Pontivivens ytuae]